MSLSVKHDMEPFDLEDPCVGIVHVPVNALLSQCANDKCTCNMDYPCHSIINKAFHFEDSGELADLNEVILQLQTAVQLTDAEHPNKLLYLVILGDSQQVRFEHLGQMIDLENSISNLKNATLLNDYGHPGPGKSDCLGALGESQLMRYESVGELADLQDSISNMISAILFAVDSPEILKHLISLGVSQLKHYEPLGELTDIEDCISNLQMSAQNIEDGDLNRPMCLSTRGISQLRRFERLGELQDVAESILNQFSLLKMDPHTNQIICPILVSAN
jgi:hypothetical protein